MRRAGRLVALLAGAAAAGCGASPRADPGPLPLDSLPPGCTAFVLRSGGAVVVGRNLDWPVGVGAVLVNPRGVVRRAAGSDGAVWVARHASVTFNQFGAGRPLGGLNEAGLVVEELSYHPARYPPPDDRAAADELEWIQYVLDRHATVTEVIRGLDDVRIRRRLFGLHYLVADRTGAAAVVEFLDGRTVVHGDAELPVPVLANDRYANLVRYLGHHVGFGGDREAGPGPESPERFVRAATAVRRLAGRGLAPPAAVDSAFAVLRDVEQDDTRWSVVYVPGEGRVHYRTARSPGVRSVALSDHPLDCGARARGARLDGPAASGLTAWTESANRRLLDDLRSEMRRRLPEVELPDPLWGVLQAAAGAGCPPSDPGDPLPRPPAF